jgi:hypothetical protein
MRTGYSRFLIILVILHLFITFPSISVSGEPNDTEYDAEKIGDGTIQGEVSDFDDDYYYVVVHHTEEVKINIKCTSSPYYGINVKIETQNIYGNYSDDSYHQKIHLYNGDSDTITVYNSNIADLTVFIIITGVGNYELTTEVGRSPSFYEPLLVCLAILIIIGVVIIVFILQKIKRQNSRVRYY